MAGWRCAAGEPWRLEIAENEARKGRETYADGLGKAPKDQGSSLHGKAAQPATSRHSFCRPRRSIHSASDGRSNCPPDTASMERMSRKCFSEPPSR